jgi:hydroxymethylpyrimidine pyrophosphatase-like HAD family hydrolase
MSKDLVKESIVIAVDFDGTCVTHEYPQVGQDIGAIPVLKKLVENEHQLILNTMRSGRELGDAIDWFKENGIELYGVGYNPTQARWTTSNKCYAELYIDDAGLGAPLSIMKTKNDDGDEVPYGRSFINWNVVEEYLTNMGLINQVKSE